MQYPTKNISLSTCTCIINCENSHQSRETHQNDFFSKVKQIFSRMKTNVAVPSPMPKIRYALDRSVNDSTAILGLTALMRHWSICGR